MGGGERLNGRRGLFFHRHFLKVVAAGSKPEKNARYGAAAEDVELFLPADYDYAEAWA